MRGKELTIVRNHEIKSQMAKGSSYVKPTDEQIRLAQFKSKIELMNEKKYLESEMYDPFFTEHTERD